MDKEEKRTAVKIIPTTPNWWCWDEMKLHWVGERKEGKSWNNSMKSEGWACLWARVHGEGGRAEKREMISTASERVRQDRQAQQRFSMETQGQGAKKRNHQSQKKPFQWEQGWVHWKFQCAWDLHLPEGKSYWEEQQCWATTLQGHFLPTFPVHKQTKNKLLYKYI